MKTNKFTNKFTDCKQLKDDSLLCRLFIECLNCGNYYGVVQKSVNRLVKCAVKYALNFFHVQCTTQSVVTTLNFDWCNCVLA
jgi:hypothetical protein